MTQSSLTKVALINPPYNNHRLLFFSLPYLVNGLRKKNLSADFKVFDCPAMQYDMAELFRELQEYRPDIVGVSVPFTLSLKPALHIINACKKLFPKACIVSGGAHASLCPEDLIEECDYVVIGDGERPMARIIHSYQSNSKKRDIPGTAISEKGRMIIMPLGKIDHGTMGSPDWDGFDLRPFFTSWVFGEDKKGFSVFTSKGCPYNCTYCSNHILTDRKVAYRDLNEVIAEIQWFQKKYSINLFNIADEVFTLDRDRVFKFCDMLDDKKINIEWTFQTRANLIKDKDILLRVKKSGARAVSMGIESGNAGVLRLNKHISLEEIEGSVRAVKNAGLLVYGGFIIGFPEDTIDTVWDTITLPDKLDIDSPGFQLMVPYPKTMVREKAFKEGGILTNDFSEYTTYGVVYVPPGLNGYDLLAIRKFAFQYFHTRSRKRVDDFLKRFVGTKDFESIKRKYNLMHEEKDKYNKEYLMGLKDVKDGSKDQKEVEPLPV